MGYLVGAPPAISFQTQTSLNTRTTHKGELHDNEPLLQFHEIMAIIFATLSSIDFATSAEPTIYIVWSLN